jgi:glycerol-3-phosphate dehydrogenase
VSRQHRVIPDGPGGRLLTVTGTKLTCFRSLAEAVGRRVLALLGRRAEGGAASTARLTLDGLDEDVAMVEGRVALDVSEELAATGLGRDTLEHLVETYGRGYGRVLELGRKLPDGLERLCPTSHPIVAQLHHAVAEEMAVSLQDVMLRRTGLGHGPCQGMDCAPAAGRRMAELCGWSSRRLDAELAAYAQVVDRGQRFRGGPAN